MRVKVILNPYAGQENVKQRVSRVESALSRAGLEYDLITTCRRGQAREEAILGSFGKYDAVVAAGGDGTVHEVINGLILASAGGNTCPMGILPMGNSNDFSDMASIPRDLDRAVNVIAGGQETQVDAGFVKFRCRELSNQASPYWQSCYFVNSCALAIEPIVKIEAKKMAHLLGKIRYIVALLRVLRNMEVWLMQISWDSGAFEGPTTLLSVANSPRTGGLFMVAPDAKTNDGLFDFVIAPKLPISQVLTVLPRLMTGSHIHHPAIIIGRTARLHIQSQPGSPIYGDGEVIANSADIVECCTLPGVISLLSP
ncbi:MAG: diacylglycerol kinase family lipid kinase [Chloroflexota bacterium]|jgi:diacylglycerol kinase (ATP)